MPNGHGGARTGSGRPKGGRNLKPQIDLNNPVVAELVAAELRARSANPALKEGRELLSQAANLMFGIVARCQQQPLDAVGLPIDPDMRKTFLGCLDRGCRYAGQVAPYQSPTFRAIIVAPDPGQQDEQQSTGRVVNLTVFEGGKKTQVAMIDDLTEREPNP